MASITCPDHPDSNTCRHPAVIYEPHAPPNVRAERCAAAQVLHRAASAWQGFVTTGTRHSDEQARLDWLAETTLNPAIRGGCEASAPGLIAPTARLLGVQRTMVRRAAERVDSGSELKRAKRSDAYPLERIFNFFHGDLEPIPGIETLSPADRSLQFPDMSNLVELDKGRTHRWDGKRVSIAGTERFLTCHPKFSLASRSDLAAEFLESKVHHQVQQQIPGASISANRVKQCICPCIKPKTIVECACPTCVAFDCALRGLNKAMASRRKETGCLDCSEWATALRSSSHFSDAAFCKAEVLPGCELNGNDLYLRPLACCLSDPLDAVAPCARCGIEKALPTCSCLSAEALAQPCSWFKHQEKLEGKHLDQVNIRLARYDGTVGECLEQVRSTYKSTQEHRWRSKFLRRQFHLDCAHFDPDTEAVVHADFSSAMQLGAGHKATCESDATCNLYVVLVLYSTNGQRTCDYVRFWSPATTRYF